MSLVNKILSAKQVQQWKNQGYVLASGLISDKLVASSKDYLSKKYYNTQTVCQGFGSRNGELEFPSYTVLDQITLHQPIIKSVQILLNTPHILLSQSDAWSKMGNTNTSKFKNTNQRMHMDYGNNTFLHPPHWDSPEAVSMIIYFSDVSITGGGTAIVPKCHKTQTLYQPPYIHMPGIFEYNFYNDKNYAEIYMKQKDPKLGKFRNKLYQHEIVLQPKIGDILFYRLDIWHRGTPVKMGKIRNVMNLVWKKRNCFWISQWNPGFTKKMYYGILEKMITEMTPLQRSVLGFPLPEDKYWTKENIKHLRYRYPKMDIGPYLQNYTSKL